MTPAQLRNYYDVGNRINVVPPVVEVINAILRGALFTAFVTAIILLTK
jgi:hypothetical protein